MPAGVPERVLIVRLGAIGDVVNALVLANSIKAARPDTHVGWAAHDLVLPLVEKHPSIDRMHLWRRGSGLEEFTSFLKGVRAERYGLAIDLQRIFKSALLARLSLAPRVLGFDRDRAKEGSWMWTREKIPAGDPGAHMVLQYLEFARYLGVAPSEPLHRLPEDAEAERWAAALVAEFGRRPIVLNVGASKPPNRWPAARFGELARRIADDHGLPICFTGGPDDAAFGVAAWEALGEEPQARNLVGATSLLQLCALLRRARLTVTCDTGAMHIAAAVGTPVVALFGPADPGRTGPWGEIHRVVRAPGVPGVMAEIGVDLVRSAVYEQLADLR